MCSIQTDVIVPNKSHKMPISYVYFTMTQQPPVGQGFLIIEDS
jgi:hypothetical protein